MKRILTLLLVLALSVAAFTSCAVVDTVKGWFHEHDFVEGKCECGESDPDYVPEDEDLAAAYTFIKLYYKDLSVTNENFEIMKNAPVGDKMFPITWTTNNEAITITENEAGTFYVVNIPELGDEAINYTLNFSIQNDAGEKKEGSFNLTVPAFAVNTYEEYVEAEDGTALVVRGIVTGIYSKSTNSNKENSLLIQDLEGKGGYYAYNLADDPAGVISVGMTVEVRGDKKTYYGTFELTNPVVSIIDSEIKTVTPIDITETVIAASGLDAAELVNKNGALVTIKNVTLLNYDSSNGYHNFQIGNHKAYLRVSSSSNMITKAEGETVTKTFTDNFYYKADVTGIITLYNNAIYLMPVSSAPFANLVEQNIPDDVKVDLAIDNTTVPGMIQIAGDTALPTTTSINGVTLSWELVEAEGVNCATLNGNTLTVTIPEAAQTVTLKATFTLNNVVKTKDYTITVKPISTITIEEANNIGMNMTHNTYTEELYYIVGTIDNIATNGETYGNMYIVSGEYSVYIYGLYDATGKVRYDAMDPKPLPKDTIKVLTVVGKYNNDVQLKDAKVIEHTVHEDNKVEVVPTVDFKPVNPIVGTEYYIGMTKNGAVYYITGSMATGNASYYMASTAKQAEAAKVTVLAGPTEGTYYLTVTVDGATKYLDLVVSGTHKNAVYADTAPEAGLSFDAATKTFYKTFDGENYTFGTALSNTFYTIGGVEVDTANAMLQISFAAEHTCTYTDVVTAPTCEEKGYTTHTCACGDVVVDTYVDALQHHYVDGVCDSEGCGKLDPDYHTHDFSEKQEVVAPTCTAQGYTVYACSGENCNETEKRDYVDALNHADTDGDYKCDNGTCDELVLPADGTTLTVDQALAIGALVTSPTAQKYYISGTITGFYGSKGTTYGNVYIQDENDKSILIYGLTKDGVQYDAMTTKPVVYDFIKVYGSLTSYNGTAQFATSELIEHVAHECTKFTDATCQKKAACVVCGKETGELAEHNMVNGVCSVCSYEEGAAEVVTVTISIADYAAANSWSNGTQYSTIKMNDDISVTAVKTVGNNNNTGKYYTNGSEWRTYQTESPTITVTAAAGKTIKSVKITYNVSNTGVLTNGTTNISSGTVVEVNANTITFGVGNTGSSTSGQVKITAIEVVYA